LSDRWEKKIKVRKERRKDSDYYTLGDFIFDVFFWIPELLFLPFRMLFLLVRGMGRVIDKLLDGI